MNKDYKYKKEIEEAAFKQYPLNPKATNSNKTRPGFIKGAMWGIEFAKHNKEIIEEILKENEYLK